ncbi:WavE lipopolysaccharide synthesis family protein [Xenorhabdus bovienii]|uniref:WavE lipopolysaccharide synthesis family protein n=1 Tax=Xenorhabdus bovienii TaxID=40576 RepID=UPI0023B21D90|nr:WavE lipopolysaccharide synthesis family protein [Xenorhabdus bovienii]MDE9461686.1 WavE lipopolysaccharide synthesis family protein [Xenorhabdus bovienii]MDE9469872.1 WavE lipopolysaccharide synthesis family protein [Xenorhabdus bovienii]MDE9534052.1 WavE lipopolysaccharide synthesis family protein [Xenorhabdus bovienii]MDE9586981.1 WavE lipopolysaccharide synthesis family protein [Xenorhabdus bovienii]
MKVKHVIKQKIKNLLEIIICFFSPIIVLFLDKIQDFVIYSVNKRSKSKFFFSHHKRPVKARDVPVEHIWDTDNVDFSDVAIIIQGPIASERDFTYQTVLLYKKFYRNINIIVSTWNDSNTDIIHKLQNECYVILNEKPRVSGSHNINLQKKTTLAGLYYANDLKCKYALKTRTDQRFYSWTTLPFFKKILKNNPPYQNDFIENRIIELTMSMCKFRPWSMCDMFQFGLTSDLIKMWSFPDDERNRTAREFAQTKYKIRDIVEENVAEILIHRNLANNIKVSDSISHESYFDFINKFFYLIDKETVDLFWLKYNSEEYNLVGNGMYDRNQTLTMLRTSDFLIMGRDNEKTDLKRRDLSSYLDRYEN